ncbi:MAG: hypothetical protein AB1512_19915 [Thermodesulfobacteriota bacterium]
MNRAKPLSKGRSILHFCNYSPITSGIYPETRDLVLEELRVGYEAWIVDHVPNNPQRKDPACHDDLFRAGRVIGIEEFDDTQPSDLVCWHSFVPEKILQDRQRNLVMFLHAMPSHVFYNELYGQEPVLSYLKNVTGTLPHCHAYITLWPSHRPYWENIIEEKLLVTNPIICCDSISLKPDDAFDPGRLRLVVMDTWRGGKEPYYIMNAVQGMMTRSRRGELPFEVSLHIYGQGQGNIPPVWRTLIRRGLEGFFHFKGRDDPQHIFDTHDILLTQVGEIPTESRVIREGLLSGIPIVAGHANAEWTDFKHDCRDIEGFAGEILGCWEHMQDGEARRRMFTANRELACSRYDIRKNALPIFECYEEIFARSAAVQARAHPSPSDGSPIRWDLLRHALASDEAGDLAAAVERMAGADEAMSREEAVLRLLVDLPRA